MARFKRTRQKLLDHAIARARERYGVGLSRADCRALAAQIETGDAVEIERMCVSKRVFAVWHRARILAALYDEDRRTILTFLPSAPFGLR